MPVGKRIARFRADSASYQAELIDYRIDNGIEFAIGADLDQSVRKSLCRIEEWREYGDGLIGETTHSMNKSKHPFRLIAIKRPCRQSLFVETSPRIKVIAAEKDGSAEEVAAWYNLRGECSENRIKELKLGLGMERMPCGDFFGNAAFFRIGVIAYNLFVIFRSAGLPAEWRRYQLGTVRWKFYQTAGKVAYHGNRLWLKFRVSRIDLFRFVRRGNYSFAFG